MPRRVTPRRDLAGLNGLTALLRELRPHVVHVHMPKGGLLGTLAATAAGIPVRLYLMRGLPLLTSSGG